MQKKIKSPVTGKAAKVPVVLQLEALECGAASLAMVMAYYNKWIPLEQVRVDCGVSRDGSNAKNILIAARSYGMTAKGYRYEPDSLKEKGKFPCIIHWNFNHFVVLDGFYRNLHYVRAGRRVRGRWQEKESEEFRTKAAQGYRSSDGICGACVFDYGAVGGDQSCVFESISGSIDYRKKSCLGYAVFSVS